MVLFAILIGNEVKTFAENLQDLPDASNVARVCLKHGRTQLTEIIENKPGASGSVKLYAYLAEKYGAIDTEAASEGLVLYAEHMDDARRQPGKHPNIDRLFRVQATGNTYSIWVEYV